jgi:glycosyltransferase involved in cell wall biosynthesis
MKILFLSDNFPPEVNAPANRTYEHCVEWGKKGAEVTVITCAPNFPKGKVYEGYTNKFYQKETIEGITVIRVWSYISANQGIFKRIIDYVSYAFMAFWVSLFIKTDIIIATSPQFFTAVSGYLSAFFKRKPWIMEVRDLWPESIKAVDAMEDSKLIGLLEKLELFLYKKASKVVVVTDAFKENLVKRGIDGNKVFIVKNGVQLDRFRPAEKNEGIISRLKLRDKFVVGYLGTHGMAHKLDFILDCAREVNGNIHFLFIGDGAEKDKLLELHKKWELKNVTMLPSIPKKEIENYINITDVALVPLKKSDTFKTVIPSKIFENSAMKKPILLGVQGESKAIIEKYQAGICFEPENKKDFLEKLHHIQDDQSFYKACQAGCDKLAIDFDRKILAEKMYQLIADILK